MRILDRYIGQTVQLTVLVVLTVVLALFLFFNYVNEIKIIGRGDYTAMVAFEYVLLRLPKLLYQFFPMAALLGTMLGLGLLGSHSELVVLRASGVSKLRIAWSAIKAMLLLILIAFFVGEVVAPPAEQYGQQMRLQAIGSKVSFNTHFGLWIRDGRTFINVRSVDDQGNLQGVNLYIFDEQRSLVRRIQARTAVHAQGIWELRQVRVTDIGAQGIVTTTLPSMPWRTLLDRELVDTVSYDPDSLSLWEQIDYIDYLRRNGLDARLYELAFWNKLVMPVTILAMVLIAVPFVFASGRESGMGRQILVGFLIGIVFYIVQRLMGQVGVVYDLPPWLAASTPTLLVVAVSVWMYRRLG